MGLSSLRSPRSTALMWALARFAAALTLQLKDLVLVHVPIRAGEACSAPKRRLILEDAADSRGGQATAPGTTDPMDADLSLADVQPGHNMIIQGNGTEHYYSASASSTEAADTTRLSAKVMG